MHSLLLATPNSQMGQHSATSQNEFTQELTSFVTRLENQSTQQLATLSGSDKNGNSSKKAEKPGEENVVLPTELIEKIIARLPFPCFFRARLLSKAWCAKFRLTREGRTTPLQNELEVTALPKWTTYYPVFLSRSKLLYGFDRISYQWESMFTLSDLQFSRDVASAIECDLTFVDFLAPLMLLRNKRRVFYVTNIFTGSWRQLCKPESCKPQVLAFAKLLPDKSGLYKVLFVYIVDDANRIFNSITTSDHILNPVKTVIYDSSLNEWTETISQEKMHIDPNNLSSAYLHGKLYLITFCEQTSRWELYICNVDSDQEWMVMPLLFDSTVSYHKLAVVLLCGQTIMMVTCQDVGTRCLDLDIEVYRLDLHTLQLVKVFKVLPPRVIARRTLYATSGGLWKLFHKFGSDENFIYYYNVRSIWSSTRIFNVQTLEWSSFPYERHNAIWRSPVVRGQNPFLWSQP